MCGRFTLKTELPILIERFNIHIYNQIEAEYSPRYNIAPSQRILAVVSDGEHNRLGYIKWGLVPSWSKDSAIGNKMINARAETLASKPSFAQPFKRQRCLILADSFYEWSNKIPIRIRLKNDQPFAMAGLWDKWRDEKGQVLSTCTIITTKPNRLLASIHDRMPAILIPEDEKQWLDRSLTDLHRLASLIKPYPEELMDSYPVSTLVNSVKHDSIELITPS